MTVSALLRSPNLLQRDRSRLLVVDVQEKLMPAIDRADEMLRRVRFLLDAAELFAVPTLVSEQYPKGLGPTVAELAQHPAAQDVFDKTRFSAADGFCTHFGIAADVAPEADDGRDQVVIVGMETHVCVMQTAMDLTGRGFRTVVVEDGVSGGSRRDHDTGLARLRDAGVSVCSAESVAFEWCEDSRDDAFRSLSGLVRKLRE